MLQHYRGAGRTQSVYRRAMRCTAGIRFSASQEIFRSSTASRRALGSTQLLIQLAQGDLSPEIKRPICEADNTPPSSAEIKNGEAIILLPHTSSWLGVNPLSTGTTLLLAFCLLLSRTKPTALYSWAHSRILYNEFWISLFILVLISTNLISFLKCAIIINLRITLSSECTDYLANWMEGSLGVGVC
jgi:hypothetical protein